MRIVRIAGVVAAIGVALSLAGCTGSIPSAVRPTGTFGPDPTPTASHGIPFLDVGEVVATGSFRSADAAAAGDVSIVVSTPGRFGLEVSGLRLDDETAVSLEASAIPVSSGTACFDGPGWALNWGQATAGGTQQFAVDPTGKLVGDDPSFIDAVLLVRATNDPGCLASVVAVAPLTWTIPDMRPDLKIKDSGATTGAAGSVTVVDGAPIAYTVAANDVLSKIAHRFDITADDLIYLNPTRTALPSDPTVLSGEELNLSKTAR